MLLPNLSPSTPSLYEIHELQRAAMAPFRMGLEFTRLALSNPLNPLSHTPAAQFFNAAAQVFEHVTRRYGRPDWGIEQVTVDGRDVPVAREVVMERSFMRLQHFACEAGRDVPRLLIVAPLSGHFATLLRGTVQTLLADHDVYVTDWRDARMVPLAAGNFTLASYVDYVIDCLHFLGPGTHVLAVCQPAVPVMAAVSVMASWGDVCAPATMTLIGGPIDTRRSPTAVNTFAKEHPIEWFERNVVVDVPLPYPGAGRRVYPGFIQLTNFIGMNLERHVQAHQELFDHLVTGDEDSAAAKRDFYEEFLAVMDIPADFYLDTVATVFHRHDLPEGTMRVRWQPVDPARITSTAILCIEGERDDISGVGQTRAALDLTPNLPDDMKAYHLQAGAGHYGVFNGSRFRAEVAPRIGAFTRRFDPVGGSERRVQLTGWRGKDRRTRPRGAGHVAAVVQAPRSQGDA